MPNAEKIEKVAALKERIQDAEALLLTEYRGLSVHDATELRRALSEQARFAIVKNTLMVRAAADAGIAELEALLDGPTAVAFVQGDVVATAKKVVDAAKKFPALVIKGGYLDGKVLSAAEAQSLATLESREAMLSKVAGMLKAELTRAASMFEAIQGRFLGVLEAYKEKLPGEVTDETAEAEPAAETEPADQAEPAADTEPAAQAEPAAETEPAAQAEPAADATTDDEPDARPQGEPQGEPEEEPEGKPEEEPEGKPEGKEE
jgi:large subunit ribosomal protein L10